MAYSTFYTSDRSQIEMHIYPSKENKFLSYALPFLGVLFILGSFVSGKEQFWSNLGKGIGVFLFYFMVKSLDSKTEYHITLSNKGLSICKIHKTSKEKIYPISCIVRFEEKSERIGKNHYVDILQMCLSDGNMVKIPSNLSNKKQKIFIKECNEFLHQRKNVVKDSAESLDQGEIAAQECAESLDQGEIAAQECVESLDQGKSPVGEEATREEYVVKEQKIFTIDPDSDALLFADQPADSKWVRDEEASEFTIVGKGEFSLTAFLAFLGFDIFLNAIYFIGLFVRKDLKSTIDSWWWSFYLFLIPIGLIDLFFLGILLDLLLANWREEKWTFTPNEIRYEKKTLGIKIRRKFDVSRIERVEFESGFLRFVAGKIGEEDEICSIPLDSQEEAHWLGAKFYQIRGKM